MCSIFIKYSQNQGGSTPPPPPPLNFSTQNLGGGGLRPPRPGAKFGQTQGGLQRPVKQWRSEGGQGGDICPRAPPGGGRQNPAKEFLKNYIR